jgi:haloalkane dehalogenase
MYKLFLPSFLICALPLCFLLVLMVASAAAGQEDGPKPGVLRTPEERFQNLAGYDFEPHYVNIDGLRIHYLDEGPPDAAPVLLMHGEPSWSYLYRNIIPILTDAGHRVIVPDLVGFGRSDKLPRMEDYSYQMQVDTMTAFVKSLDLNGATLFCQDWGGLIGLRVVAEEPDRFARIVAANTGLPDAGGIMGRIGPTLFRLRVWMEGTVTREELQEDTNFIRWVAYSKTTPEFPVGGIVQLGATSELPPEVVAAYDAPFPDDGYKAGARVMPSLVPSQLVKNHEVWKQVFEKWDKPFLTAFSDSDPITKGQDKAFQSRVPGAKGQPHVTVKGAGHFLQEDTPEEVARIILDFIQRTNNIQRTNK